MKRLFPVLMAIVVVACLGSSAWSQPSANPMKIYLHGGASIPQSDFADAFKLGYHGGGAIGLALMSGFEAMARVSYHSFDPDAEGDMEFDGGRFTALLYGIEGKLNLGTAGSGLFVAAGAGYAKLDITDVTYTDELGAEQTHKAELDDQTYFALAAGIEFDRMFIEARYVKILEDIVLNELSTDVDEQGSLVFLPISIGFKF